MAERINFEFEEQEIELTDGTVLTLPARTKEINDKISELAKKAGIMNEYDFYKENLIALFGRGRDSEKSHPKRKRQISTIFQQFGIPQKTFLWVRKMMRTKRNSKRKWKYLKR